MRAAEVFTPQKSPTVTLITNHLTEMTAAFADTLDEGGNLIRVVGPSKSGKTVFIKNLLGQHNLVFTTGAGVNSADDLWMRVLDAVGSDITQTTQQGSESGGSIGGSGTVSGNVFVASGTAEVSLEKIKTESSSVSRERAVDLLQLVIREFNGSGLTIFIDDFHYVASAAQKEIAQQLKQAVEGGVAIVCAAVPFRSEDALRANDDLQGRIRDFLFDYWNPGELIRIAERGFPHLNIRFHPKYGARLALEAAGSPQLMQALCLNTCYELSVRETSEAVVDIPLDDAFFQRVCGRVAGGVDFTSTIDQMKAGPLIRGRQRNSYALKDGSNGDVYPILVKALALDPPTLHIRYPELVRRVETLCARDSPSGSSISDACHHLARIANSGFSTEKVDWNPEAPLLSIRDPYLLFALRWTA